MEDQQETRALYNGFGHTMARAFELVVTPALFALIGHFIDRAAGTRRFYQLDPTGLAALRADLDRFWRHALASYADIVDQLEAGSPIVVLASSHPHRHPNTTVSRECTTALA